MLDESGPTVSDADRSFGVRHDRRLWFAWNQAGFARHCFIEELQFLESFLFSFGVQAVFAQVGRVST
ncbi:hypothetical protein GC163_22205 [bacterium]|nr:hypothetical protein [bacterium]